MSEFNPNKIDFSTINGGQKYKNGDSVQADAINNAIEASAWAQALATNQPNVENIGNVGTPSVSIETLPNGTPRLKFENLKGDIGVEDIPSKKIEYIERVMLDTVPLLDGMWLKNDTLYTEKETFKRTDYIEVEPNKEYTLCVYYRDEEASKTVSNGKIFDAPCGA